MTFTAAPRLAVSLPVGLLITVAMAAFMQALITPTEAPPPPPIPAYEVFRPLTVKPEPPPSEEPVRPEWIRPEVPGIGVVIAIPPESPRTDLPDVPWTSFRPMVATGNPQDQSFVTQGPQLMFQPFVDYPPSMYPREGSCDVSYDITDAGATTNIQVVSCTDRGFGRFAERVVERAVYRPAQGETGPVASPGHRMSVAFEIAE